MAQFEFNTAKAELPKMNLTSRANGLLKGATKWYGQNYFISYKSNSTT